MTFSLVCFGQSPSDQQGDSNCAEPINQGIIVEGLARDYPGLRLGLRIGDVLLGWSRGNENGRFASPMDLLLATVEQVPRGAITVQGSRDGIERTWQVDAVFLGVSTRPNFCEKLLTEYLLGKELAKSGKNQAAIERWQKAATDYAPEVGWLQWWLTFRGAELFAADGDLAQMDGNYLRAIQGMQNSNPAVAAEWAWGWGGIYYTRGDYAAAERGYEHALLVAPQDESANLLRMFILEAASRVADEQGKDSLALSYLLESEQLEKRALGSSSLTSIALATHYGITRDLDKAEQYYWQALGNARNKNSQSGIFVSLHGLGMVANERADYHTALRILDRALLVGERFFPDNIALAPILEVLGIAARESGDLHKARNCFDRSLEIARRRSGTDVIVARNLNHIAILLERDNDRPGAERYLREALGIVSKAAPDSIEAAWIYMDLGEVLAARKEFSEAEQNFEKALRILNVIGPYRIETASTLAALAKIKRSSGDLQTAAQILQRSLSVLENRTAHLGGSSDVRAGFRAKHEKYYREYADLLLSQDKPEEAFTVIERSHARTLLETLNAGHVNIQTGADKELLEQERSLNARINAKSERRARLLAAQHTEEQIKAIEKEISDLTSEYQDVQAQIRSTSPAYAALTQPQPLTAKEIQQQLLDSDTMVLEYSLGEERSFVFAVTPDSIHAYELPKKAEIEEQARKVHRLLAARRTAVRGESPDEKRRRMALAGINFDRAAAELSRMVLGPLAEQLKDKRLLVVTDGALAYVPFSLLPEPRAPDAAHGGEPVPLIVNHEIVNLPSASVLAVLRQQEKDRKPASKAVAVLADPVFDRHDPRLGGMVASRTTSAPQPRGVKRDSLDELLATDTSANMLTRSATDLGLARGGQLALPRLRFSRQEADAILKVTPRGEGLEAVDFNANRATAISPELGQYRIVHFATHGLLNSEHPELSGLVLSLVDKKGKPQNGFLTLQDIYNLNLPADLVVLSACETGLGKEISGEGLIGLTRGFMYAGATRVVASLWKVSDAATAQLMAEFYRGMEKDGLAPAAALRGAQIAMWKQKRWRHPYYWAAFQIQGEWK